MLDFLQGVNIHIYIYVFNWNEKNKIKIILHCFFIYPPFWISYIYDIMIFLRNQNLLFTLHVSIVLSVLLSCPGIFYQLYTISNVRISEIYSYLSIYMNSMEISRIKLNLFFIASSSICNDFNLTFMIQCLLWS